MRRHRFDLLSFVTGLVFAASGIAYLVNDGRWRFDAGPWVWPVVLFIGGAVVLLSTIADERSARIATASGPDAEHDGVQAPVIHETGVIEIDDIEPGDEAS